MTRTQPAAPDPSGSGFPRLSRPAQRALAAAGYERLEQLTRASAADLLRLHGLGPKTLDQLRPALAQRGLALAGESAP